MAPLPETYPHEAIDALLHAAPGCIDAAAYPGGYEPVLRLRLYVEEQLAAEARAGTTDSPNWRGGADGRYDYMALSDEWPPYVRTTPRMADPLGGLELSWAEEIDRRAEASGDAPVVFLDFGGGLGQTMLRIAAQERYGRLIQDGRLVLVVSSLGEAPTPEPDHESYTHVAKQMNYVRSLSGDPDRYTIEDLDLVQRVQQRVVYVDAAATELERVRVPTCKGAIPLLGSVGCLNETMVIQHSHIPDVALAVFARLLKPDGLLYLGTKATHYLNLCFRAFGDQQGQPLHTDTDEYHRYRQDALRVGLAALSGLDVHFIRDYDAGPRLYRKNHGTAP